MSRVLGVLALIILFIIISFLLVVKIPKVSLASNQTNVTINVSALMEITILPSKVIWSPVLPASSPLWILSTSRTLLALPSTNMVSGNSFLGSPLATLSCRFQEITEFYRWQSYVSFLLRNFIDRDVSRPDRRLPYVRNSVLACLYTRNRCLDDDLEGSRMDLSS